MSVWKRLGGRLYRKYLAYFAMLVSAVVITGGVSELFFSYHSTRDATILLYQEKAASAALRIEQFIHEIEQHMGWTNLFVRSADPVAQRQMEFVKLLRQAPAITDAVWLDVNGREQVRVSRLATDRLHAGTDFSQTPAFEHAKTGSRYRGPVYFRDETEPYMTLAMPSGNGVILVEINLKFVWDVVTKIHIEQSGHAYVIDANGQLIAHPDISLVLKHTSFSSLPQVRRAIVSNSSQTGKIDNSMDSRDVSGHSVLSAFSKIDSLGWIVFVEQNTSEALAPLYSAMLRTGALIIFGLALALVASAVLARRMVRPIQLLRAGAVRIGAGALDSRIEITTGDELEELAIEFDRMADRLQESYSGLEKKVEERTEELIAANTAKTRFLAAASHDLRQPMHALGLFVAQLKERSNDPELLPLIQRVESAVTALQGLLDALLDVSRLDAGVITPNIIDFNADTVLEHIENAFAAEADAKELRFRVRRNHRCVLLSDPVLLERILINLVANALRYTTSGGIVVGCRRRGEQIRIEVWDTGIGIEPQHLNAIFQEFFQIGNPERDRNKGLGLGLSIAARLARLLGARLEVKSIPGRGSVFTLEVPRGDASRAEETIDNQSVSSNRLQGATLLIVDDDALAREALAGLLTQWGCTVLSASCGYEALFELSSQTRLPDAILCDYRLPGNETGSDVIQRIRNHTSRNLPAALITGDTAPERLAEAKASGIPLLHKPLQPARLRALVEFLISSSTN